MNITKNRHNLKLGILFALISAASGACMNAFVKELGNSTSTTILIFFRFMFSFCCLIPWIIKDKNFSLRVDKPANYAIRIVCALLALTCVFSAVKRTSLTTVLLLSNTAPLFIPVFAAILYKIKTRVSIYLSIIVGFFGVAIVLHPTGSVSISSGEIFAILAGIMAAMAMLQVRILSKTSTTIQILFYYYGVSAIVTGIAAIFQWNWPDNYYQWIILILVGITGTIYQVCITLAVSSAPARIITPLTFTSVIWGGTIEYLIWNKQPDIYTIAGFLIIITSIIFVVYLGNKHIIPKK